MCSIDSTHSNAQTHQLSKLSGHTKPRKVWKLYFKEKYSAFFSYPKKSLENPALWKLSDFSLKKLFMVAFHILAQGFKNPGLHGSYVYNLKFIIFTTSCKVLFSCSREYFMPPNEYNSESTLHEVEVPSHDPTSSFVTWHCSSTIRSYSSAFFLPKAFFVKKLIDSFKNVFCWSRYQFAGKQISNNCFSHVEQSKTKTISVLSFSNGTNLSLIHLKNKISKIFENMLVLEILFEYYCLTEEQ